MGLIINTNQHALSGQSNLRKTQSRISRQLARISSGLRINGASDDAAGLSIATRLEAQQRGYTRTIQNANEAISLSQTMDGSYQEVIHNLQRMRELVVQAGNETLSDEDRSAIQVELEQLKDQIDLAGGQEFNTQELFGADFSFHLAVDSDTQVGLNLKTHKLAADRLGHQVVVESLQSVDATTNLASGQVQITNREGEVIEIRATADSDDRVSTQSRAGSAIAKAAAINSSTHLHGVTARALSTVVTGQQAQSTTLDTTNYLKINGAVISGFDVVESDVDGALSSAINAVSEETGVVASQDAQGQMVLTAKDGRNIAIEVFGTAANTGLVNGVFGASLELQSPDTFTLDLSADAVNTALGKFTDQALINAPSATYGIANGARALSGQDNVSSVDGGFAGNFTLSGVSTGGAVLSVDPDEADDLNFKSVGDLITFDGRAGVRSMELNDTIAAGQTTTVSLNVFSGVGTQDLTAIDDSFGSTLETPSGAAQSLVLQTSTDNGASWVTQGTFVTDSSLPATDIATDLDSKRLEDARLNLVVTESSDYKVRVAQLNHGSIATLSIDHYAIVYGEVRVDAISPDPLVFGENYDHSVETVDVSSKETADRSLQIIDQALSEVTEARVALGAVQARLESTIRNMDQTRGNLAHAQSRILDADFALESSELAQQQIIQQAGVSILAQANQQTSVALSLLG